jgi:threonine dehydratase
MGYASIVTEVEQQLNGAKPSCFVVSIGGGGLLMGILKGLEKAGALHQRITDSVLCSDFR